MFEYTDTYDNTIGNYWESYVRQQQPIPDHLNVIRPEILDSWKRSLAFHVNPECTEHSHLNEQQILQLQEKNHLLISVAREQMQQLYFYIRGTNFAMVLVSADGYVIDMLADDTLIQQKASKSGLSVGCVRSEKSVGTSGITICLSLGVPYAVYGKEHFIRAHHEYICCAAPVKNRSQTVVGCLGLIGPLKSAPPHTLALITSAAKNVEKELYLRSAYQKLSISNQMLETTLNALEDGVLLINRKGKILHRNDTARKLLGENSQEKSHSLQNLGWQKDVIHTILQTKTSIYRQEISVPDSHQKEMKVMMDVVLRKANDPTLLVKITTMQEISKLVNRVSGSYAKCTFDSIIGNSEKMEQVRRFGKLAAKHDSNILILGESGTGKDVLAQAIHNASPRANGPYIPINCAALPKNLIESELFGYEGGAFTGADKKGHPGKFELAEGGTIFLDEIGDMPLELQTTLLRVLQNREIMRVGGKNAKKINVRIIAATNSDLEAAVARKEFRSDLYYRLNVLSICIPSLRERLQDIPPLVEHFSTLHKTGFTTQELFSPNTLRAMMSYSWPGNVRELENFVERVMITSTDPMFSVSDILETFLYSSKQNTNILAQSEIPNRTSESDFSTQKYAFSQPKIPTGYYEDIPATQNEAPHSLSPNEERELIIRILTQEHGHVESASRHLDMSKRTLYRKIKKYNIHPENYRSW